jgi:hypothetical protein
VPIHGFFKGTGWFPIQKCTIFCKFKEIKELRGGVLLCAAQAISQACPPWALLVRLRRYLSAFGVIDAEIAAMDKIIYM